MPERLVWFWFYDTQLKTALERELVLTHKSTSTVLNNNILGYVPVSLNLQHMQKVQKFIIFWVCLCLDSFLLGKIVYSSKNFYFTLAIVWKFF